MYANDDDNDTPVTDVNIHKTPITVGTILTLLPLMLALIGGVGAFSSLQLQITELKVSQDKDSMYLKETLDNIRSDLKELKQREKKNVTQSR